LDALRALALVRVMIWHVFGVAAITYVAAMPAMFFVTGSLLAKSLGRRQARAVLVEDMAKNLKPAKALGMTTVWVDNGSDHGNHLHRPEAIDVTITDVADWLTEILEDAHVG